MLGIVIGVAAVIAMVTMGAGVTAQVGADLSRLGTNLLLVRPGASHSGGSGSARSDAPAFTLADVQAIEREIPEAVAVAPVDTTALQAIAGDRNRLTNVMGSSRRVPARARLAALRGPLLHRGRGARGRGRLRARRQRRARSVRRRGSAGPPDPARLALLSQHRRARGQGGVELRLGPGRLRARAAALVPAPARRQRRRALDLRGRARRRLDRAPGRRSSRSCCGSAATCSTATTTSRSAT